MKNFLLTALTFVLVSLALPTVAYAQSFPKNIDPTEKAKFVARIGVIKKLNPHVNFKRMAVGQSYNVPNGTEKLEAGENVWTHEYKIFFASKQQPAKKDETFYVNIPTNVIYAAILVLFVLWIFWLTRTKVPKENIKVMLGQTIEVNGRVYEVVPALRPVDGKPSDLSLVPPKEKKPA